MTEEKYIVSMFPGVIVTPTDNGNFRGSCRGCNTIAIIVGDTPIVASDRPRAGDVGGVEVLSMKDTPKSIVGHPGVKQENRASVCVEVFRRRHARCVDEAERL